VVEWKVDTRVYLLEEGKGCGVFVFYEGKWIGVLV
jgi:hypothetical protein